MEKYKHHFHSPALGIFIIRLVAGAIFLSHGITKLSNMHGTIAFFASLGFGAFLAWAVAIIEVLGGLSFILGLWTKWFGALLAAIMIVVIIKLKASMGLGKSETEFMLLATSIAIIFSGCGHYSICKLWHKDCAECANTNNCTCNHGMK